VPVGLRVFISSLLLSTPSLYWLIPTGRWLARSAASTSRARRARFYSRELAEAVRDGTGFSGRGGS
jgi:hypothetical protein